MLVYRSLLPMSHCFTNPLNGEQRIGTVGLPDGVDAKIIDKKLYIKGPTVFVDDWYDTGDLAEQDEKGYFKILGRHIDQINIKGIKVNPMSLEQQLTSGIDGIGECVIFGKDRVKCLYTGDINPELIKNFLTRLGSHCRPTLVQHISTIPQSPSGKISRSYLESQFD